MAKRLLCSVGCLVGLPWIAAVTAYSISLFLGYPPHNDGVTMALIMGGVLGLMGCVAFAIPPDC